ncbi:unnamed protein product [Eruca vesicaria subsp. sativa]|uniref:Uncharacterized protein n=1 Tax=Eruca vesicaria subsp. sativa TaxID=29727 RepID=A0ABC8KR92_ERUVS|nr:unnamed protein product [Eruca vesicaria subsp. sativa]
MYKRLRESNVRAVGTTTTGEFLNWSKVLNGVGDERTGHLESDNIERGSGDGEKNENGHNRDVEGVGCLEIDKEYEQYERTMGTQEQEHEQSLDKGNNLAARELKDYLLDIQRQIEPSTRKMQVPNQIDHLVDVISQTARVNRSGASGHDHTETPASVGEFFLLYNLEKSCCLVHEVVVLIVKQQDNASDKSLSSQGTLSERVRPCLSNLLKNEFLCQKDKQILDA